MVIVRVGHVLGGHRCVALILGAARHVDKLKRQGKMSGRRISKFDGVEVSEGMMECEKSGGLHCLGFRV
jgi:hypothetical protein